MSAILGFLKGKKTHLLVIVGIILGFFGQVDTSEMIDLTNVDTGAVQNAVMLGLVSTLKASWDRFTSK